MPCPNLSLSKRYLNLCEKTHQLLENEYGMHLPQ
jgi:hypothetical protein